MSDILNQVEILDTPDKSPSDKKDYRLIRLSNNGLKALLISNSSAASSENSGKIPTAVALQIDVGGFHDQEFGVPGLAHFVEHMIFMGSKSYPAENDFEKHLVLHGGSYNASTGYEHTKLYFSVSEEGLNGSLDRFSRLFVEPLMLKDSINRERESVESEFQIHFNSDFVRLNQLISSLANETHPKNFFIAGNSVTLKDNITDGDLYEKVHEFRNRFYVANRSYLCIQSERTLDDLQNLIVKYFSDMPYNPNTDAPLANNPENSYDKAFKPEFYEKIYYVKPKKHVDYLYITWCIPSYLKHYGSKSLFYVATILEYQGPGSLFSFLNKHLWATRIVSVLETNSTYSLYCLSIALTDLGVENVDLVLDAVFSYLLLLQTEGPSREYFEKLKEIADNSFRFRDESSAMSNVTDLVDHVAKYEPKDIITGTHLYFDYNEPQIKEIIGFLNERKFNVLILTDKYEKYDKQEKWYGTEYAAIDFPKRFIDLWNNRTLKTELYLPGINPYVCSNFEIYYKAGDVVPEYPTKIVDNEFVECWYRLDDKFLLPNVIAKMKFLSPLLEQSVHSCVLGHLYESMFDYYTTETVDLLREAKYSLTFSYSENMFFTISISGYSEKIAMVFDVFIDQVRKLPSLLTEAAFRTSVETMKKRYSGYIKSFHLASSVQESLMRTKFYSYLDIYNEIEKVTFEDMKEFAENWYREMKVVALVQGTILEKDVMNIVEEKLLTFPEVPVNQEFLTQRQCRELPYGSNYLRFRSLLDNDKNSYVYNVYQVEPISFEMLSKTSMTVYILKEPLFDNLRTQQQLGYSVHISKTDDGNYLMVTVTVKCQENMNSAKYVNEKIDEFLNVTAMEIFEKLTDEEFNFMRNTYHKMLIRPNDDLEIECFRNWSEIREGDYIFGRSQKMAETFKNLTKNDIVEFYRKYLLKENHRKLSIQIIGNVADGENVAEGNKKMEMQLITDPKVEDGHVIDDYESFKDALAIHPVIKFNY